MILKSLSRRLACLAVLFAVPIGACQHHDQMHAVLWMQRSAEYKACCLQVYNQARPQLERGRLDVSWTACLEQIDQPGFSSLPPAIIADVDETVLDNGAFNARMILERGGFQPAKWESWCLEETATAVPGSLAYLQAAAALGIRIVYLSNRKAGAEEQATRANLIRLGYPLVEAEGEDLVLTKGEVGDKSARRRRVCESYRVIALIGDNYGDFTVPVKPRKGTGHGDVAEAVATEKKRHARVVALAGYWGTKWFMLPNPAYGSWESVLLGQSKDKASLLRTR